MGFPYFKGETCRLKPPNMAVSGRFRFRPSGTVRHKKVVDFMPWKCGKVGFLRGDIQGEGVTGVFP